MSVSSTNNSTALAAATGQASKNVNPKGILGKDDFMKLLLTQLQYQDPTAPMDTATILTQTSQLASLESADNTKVALEQLTATLGGSQQFATVAAIGKTADLGSNAIAYDKGTSSTFEVYFPEEIQTGTVEILDVDGNIVASIDAKKDLSAAGDGSLADTANPSDVYQFDWDGTLSSGNAAKSGVYYVTASYKNAAGDSLTTRMGSYPIQSVKFEGANTLVKVGSNYVPLDQVKEIY